MSEWLNDWQSLFWVIWLSLTSFTWYHLANNVRNASSSAAFIIGKQRAVGTAMDSMNVVTSHKWCASSLPQGFFMFNSHTWQGVAVQHGQSRESHWNKLQNYQPAKNFRACTCFFWTSHRQYTVSSKELCVYSLQYTVPARWQTTLKTVLWFHI